MIKVFLRYIYLWNTLNMDRFKIMQKITNQIVLNLHSKEIKIFFKLQSLKVKLYTKKTLIKKLMKMISIK